MQSFFSLNYDFLVNHDMEGAPRFVCRYWNAHDYEVIWGTWFEGPKEYPQPYCERVLGFQWVGGNPNGIVPDGCGGACLCCQPLLQIQGEELFVKIFRYSFFPTSMPFKSSTIQEQ